MPHSKAATSLLPKPKRGWRGARDYDMLRTKENEVAEKLAILKTRDDDSWHDLGTGVERTWRGMAESVRDLIERLR